MATPGTRIFTHNKPDKWPSWAPHVQPGWYLGPEMEHYRCHEVYIDKTRETRISDTVHFLAQIPNSTHVICGCRLPSIPISHPFPVKSSTHRNIQHVRNGKNGVITLLSQDMLHRTTTTNPITECLPWTNSEGDPICITSEGEQQQCITSEGSENWSPVICITYKSRATIQRTSPANTLPT